MEEEEGRRISSRGEMRKCKAIQGSGPNTTRHDTDTTRQTDGTVQTQTQASAETVQDWGGALCVVFFFSFVCARKVPMVNERAKAIGKGKGKGQGQGHKGRSSKLQLN